MEQQRQWPPLNTKMAVVAHEAEIDAIELVREVNRVIAAEIDAIVHVIAIEIVAVIVRAIAAVIVVSIE